MSTPQQNILSSLYSDLDKAISSGDNNKVVTVADKILSISSTEYLAFYCKIVAFVKLEKYDMVLGAIKKSPETNDDVLYLKAYSEYRLNRHQASLSTLKNLDQNDTRVKELNAQICYRLEEFNEAKHLILDVLKNSVDDYNDERMTNLLACQALSKLYSGESDDLEDSISLFEGIFNKATYYLGDMDYDAALITLQKAEDMCRESFEDDQLTPDEVDEELVPINVQRGYIYQKLNQTDKANALYQSVSKSSVSDVALKAVMDNNILCINKQHNIFDSKKRSKSTSNNALQHKLFGEQRRLMALNQALLYYHIPQLDLCKAKLKSIAKEWPTCNTARLIGIALLLKEKRLTDGLAQLDKLLYEYHEQGHQSEEDADVIDDLMDELTLPFTALQLNLTPKDSLNQALATPTSADDNSSKPSTSLVQQKVFVELVQKYLSDRLLSRQAQHLPLVVSLKLCAFGQHFQDSTHRLVAMKDAQKLINDALKHHQKYSPHLVAPLLELAGGFLFSRGCFPEAAEVYERMLSLHDDGSLHPTVSDGSSGSTPNAALTRRALQGQLIGAYARFDRQKAADCSHDIHFEDDMDEADVDVLETAFLFGAKYVKRLNRHPDDKNAKTMADVNLARIEKLEKKKHMKKRKFVMPKNAVPGVLPDPERWLPKKERSGYRSKRKDRRQNLRGPQGATSGVNDWDVNASQPKWNKNDGSAQASNAPKHISAAARTQKRKGGKRRGRN